MIIRKRGEKTRYYYYKKKRGRHKKTGPKPKKVIKPRKKINWDYKIVVTSNNKQIEYINVYTSLEKALKAFDEFKNENDKIIFPVKYINYKGIKEANYEYLLLKRFYENDSKVTKLRNQYGKLSDHFIINDENWIIYDKMPKLIEETFWVYGFHPKMQRKTFMWIYNSLIVDKVKNKYDFLRIFLFKNKVIIKEDDGNINIVICKNMSDGVRLYNKIEEFCNLYSFKNCIFIGCINPISDLRRDIVNDIKIKTGWTTKKILRSCTRP